MSCDLHMEHENRAAKDDITSAKGKFRRDFTILINHLSGSLTDQVVARAGRVRPLKRRVEEQLYQKYTDR